MPKTETEYDTMLHVRVTAEMKKELEKEGNISDVVRFICEEYLRKKNVKTASTSS